VGYDRPRCVRRFTSRLPSATCRSIDRCCAVLPRYEKHCFGWAWGFWLVSHAHTYLERCSGAVVAGYFCACTQHLPCRTSLVDGDFSETLTSERGFALLHVTATLLRTCGGRTALRLSNDWEDSRPARRRCAVRCIWSARYSKAETCAMGCYFVQRGRTSFIPTRTFVLGVDVRSDVA
jgi:hypothetical protein